MHQMRNLECRFVVEIYTAGKPGKRLGALSQKGLTPLVRLEYKTALKGDRDGPGVIKGLQPSHAIWSARHETATPSWVELGLRGHSCLLGPSRTILGTTLFGMPDFGALAQRVHAGRAARNEALFCTL
jgi:hypothetical protein